LPEPIFTAREPWNPERIHAMAIYCSDGRFGEAFDEFCHEKLKIPRYDRFAVPGGPAWINPSVASAQDLYRSARAQLDFLVRVHDLERIVLITHFGCAWYGQKLGRSAEECLEAQFEDLRRAAAALSAWYSGIAVEAYLAMRVNEWLSFHPVELNRSRREF